jgi:hypothetical protein
MNGYYESAKAPIIYHDKFYLEDCALLMQHDNCVGIYNPNTELSTILRMFDRLGSIYLGEDGSIKVAWVSPDVPHLQFTYEDDKELFERLQKLAILQEL